MYFLDKKIIGHTLRSARESRNITQTELAKSINRHQSCIARLEAGDSIPTLDILDKICFALNYKISLNIEKN